MHKKNKMKSIVAIAVALAFLLPGSAVFANIGRPIENEVNEITEIDDMEASSVNDVSVFSTAKSSDGEYQSEVIDWWPMFRHDPVHSGYSTGTAPDISNLLWSYTTGGLVDSSPAVVDGKVFFSSDDRNLYCLDTDGTFLWSYYTGSIMFSSPAVVDGKVFFGSSDRRVYCLDASDGTYLWSYLTVGNVKSSPVVVDGKAFFGSCDRNLYCLDAADGSVIWIYTAAGFVWSSPAVVDGKVFFGSDDNKLYCLDTDGTYLWSYNTLGNVKSSPTVVDGRVFVGSDDGNVYCLGASDGTYLWSYTTGDKVMSSPAVADGMIFVGSNDGNVYCLNIDGAFLWSYATGAAIYYSSPAVADGKVFVGNYDGNVYCLGASDGAFLWSYATGARIYSSSPAVADGMVFIGNYDGNLYCFGPDTTSPEITDVESTPSQQIPGGYVNITAIVTDDVAVDTVVVDIAGPMSTTEIMMKIPGTDAYYYNAMYAEVGIYDYFICANDTSGNEDTSDIYNFGITTDTIPPEINDVMTTPLSQETGKNVNITATVTDNVVVDRVTVDITGPTFAVEIMTKISGTHTYYYDAVYTEVGIYDYFICANDTSGNEATSDTYNFEITTDTTSPEITDVESTPSQQIPGGYVNITAIVTDEAAVDTVVVDIAGPMSTTEIMMKIPGTDAYYYNAMYAEVGIYDYFIWANDTSGNEDTSSIKTFEIIEEDTITPEITDVMATPPSQETGGNVNITATVTDNVFVDMVTVDIAGPTFATEVMTNIPGTDMYYYDAVYTDIGTYDYFIWANDTSGNEATSDTYNFEITEPIDWWPTFMHDVKNTGYSTSTAPDTDWLLWTFNTGDGERIQSSPAVANGKVFFGSNNGNIYCLNMGGALIWKYTTGDEIYTAALTAADGRVYCGGMDDKVRCLDEATGSLIWEYTTDWDVYSAPTVVNGKVFFGSCDRNLYCLDAADGSVIWIYTAAGFVYSAPAVADGKVYFGDYHSDTIYCLDAASGSLIWSYYVVGGVCMASPSVADGKVYINSLGGKLFCLDAATGSYIWDYTTGTSYSSPAVAYGKVYFNSYYPGTMCCLDAATGSLVWDYPTGEAYVSSPAIADGKVYIGSSSHGKIYCLDAENGSHIWSYAIGTTSTAPAIADGKVFVGSHQLYCFGPRLNHDLKTISINNLISGPAGIFFEPGATVENHGLNNETNVPVNMQIKAGSLPEYSETVYIDINVGEVKNVTFPEWIPEDLYSGISASIDYTITACTQLVGDEDPWNSCATVSITLDYINDVGVESFNITDAPMISNSEWIQFHTGFNNNGVGSSAGGTYEGAIRITPDELGLYDSWLLTAVKFYHYDDVTHSGNIKIYDDGASFEPGALITSEPYTVTGTGWHEIALSHHTIIDASEDIWVSVEITYAPGEHPLGIDAGPAVPEKGDWIYRAGDGWTELRCLVVDANWCIEAKVEGDILYSSGNYSVEATINNPGTFNQSNFNVNATIYEVMHGEEGDVFYHDDFVVTVILHPDEQVTITFDENVTFLDTDEGGYILEVTTELDGDDNLDNDEKMMVFTLKIPDTIPPVTTHEIDPSTPDGENGWYVSDVTITITAEDDKSGVEFTYYKLVDISEWQEYEDPVVVSADGSYDLVYYSVDYAENNEVVKGPFAFKIDQTDPTIELTWDDDNSKLVADVYDETSGVAKVYFYVNGEYVGEATEYPYEYEVTNPRTGDTAQAIVYDDAGNHAISEEIDAVPQGTSQSQEQSQHSVTQVKISGMTPEIDSVGLYPFNAEYTDVTTDTSNLGFLGDRFYGYKCGYFGSLPDGPVYFDSENPGNLTLLAPTTSDNLIAGGTWVVDTWYGSEYGTGKIWTINETNGEMTRISESYGYNLHGLAYNPNSDIMYGATDSNLYIIDISSGSQTLVGPFNAGILMIAIAFDDKDNLYGVELLTDSLYSINTSTGAAILIGSLGISLNYAQDMAYDIDNGVMYLSACMAGGVGRLYICDVLTGDCIHLGLFEEWSEIAGFAIPYTSSLIPETPEQPSGPTEGMIGVEYTFSTYTTDPEGDQVFYMWDWGDGTTSDWIGPYDSGANAQAIHSWVEEGSYDITVKSKDVNFPDRASDWSDPLTICIVDKSVIEIGGIFAGLSKIGASGLFKVNVVIKNTGSADAIDVKWNITLDGGLILLGSKTDGRMSVISAGEEKTVSSNLIFGFGKTVITVSAEADELLDTKEQDAFVLLFFIKI